MSTSSTSPAVPSLPPEVKAAVTIVWFKLVSQWTRADGELREAVNTLVSHFTGTKYEGGPILHDVAIAALHALVAKFTAPAQA
jgi:hypothetical protein